MRINRIAREFLDHPIKITSRRYFDNR